MKTRPDFDSIQLKQTTEFLVNKGFSVIPVCGNASLENPKKPFISWGSFQTRLPHQHEIDGWFRRDFSAIGIVCGRISKLMVLDFDEEVAYQQFCNSSPTLSETFTVKTRRGYHLYYTVHHRVASQKFAGGDVKAERSYVIGASSIIGDFQYYVVKNVPQQTLVPDQVNLLLDRLGCGHSSDEQSKAVTSIQESNLIETYRKLAGNIGRNNALYRVASLAKQSGIAQTTVMTNLATAHVVQRPKYSSTLENPKRRYAEAIQTIQSAYSHQSGIVRHEFGYVPNSVRETLLQAQGSTIVPRLLDLFSLANWKPNTVFTMSQAIALGEFYGLNRKSILRALSGDLSQIEGQHIVLSKTVEYPDIRGLNSSGRGRPVEKVFLVPSISRLIDLLNVKVSPSDRITARDLKSAHAYRRALHREYVRRVAPQVPIAWMADRLGVSARTIQRLNKELHVVRTANLGFFRLSKSNLGSLPKKRAKNTKNATDGYWLETRSGERFPAWRHVGHYLLKQGLEVQVRAQLASQYFLDVDETAYEQVNLTEISPEKLMEIRAFRSVSAERPGLIGVVDDLVQQVKKRLNQVRYFTFPLDFDSVVQYIAKDDVADTITSYLYAFDDDGNRVHRPAKRGIAYRMLKEFGNGRVFLALFDEQMAMWYSLAKFAIKQNHFQMAFQFLRAGLA